MSSNDWSVRIASIGAAICAAFTAIGLYIFVDAGAYQRGVHHAESEGFAAQYPFDTAKRIEQCPSEKQAHMECVEGAIRDSHEAQRSERDLNVQRDMSEWAWWTMIVSILSALVSGAGLIVLLRTIAQGADALKTAKDANQISYNIGKQGIRAYLSVVDINIIWNEHTYVFTVWVTVKNSGSTPNKYTIVYTSIKFIRQDQPDFQFQNCHEPVPDLPQGDAITVPIHYLLNPCHPSVLKEFVACEIEAVLQGEDVFGESFVGRLTGITLSEAGDGRLINIGKDGDWRKKHRFQLMTLQAASYQPPQSS